jgi:AhpD family alkylhydroperoxidase
MSRTHHWLLASLLACTASTALAEDTSAAQAARADIKATLGFVPKFLNDVPDVALPGAWEEMKGLQMNPNTALPGKFKELIGLAVAAQVPCKYCTYVHTEFAKLNGASSQEVGEAVMMAALTRHWSTFIQGTQTDYVKFKAMVADSVAYAKKQMSGQAAPPKPMQVTDAASASRDAQQWMGVVPEFVSKFPASGIAGAWKEERDVEMAETAIPGKYKSLISLAVAAQVPCKFCIEADTQFARLQGATDQEINEAIAMSALTRHWSTYLNGTAADEAQLKRDVDRLVKGAKKMMKAPKPASDVSMNKPDMNGKPMASSGKPATAAPMQAAKPMQQPMQQPQMQQQPMQQQPMQQPAQQKQMAPQMQPQPMPQQPAQQSPAQQR